MLRKIDTEIDWFGYAKYLEAAIERSEKDLLIAAQPCFETIRRAYELVETTKRPITELDFSIYDALSVITVVNGNIREIAKRLREVPGAFIRADGEGNSNGIHRMGADSTEQTPETCERGGVSGTGRLGAGGDHSGADPEARGCGKGVS